MLIKREGGLRKRSPVVNGIFYPDKREVLSGQLSSWGLKEGSGGVSGGEAILAPHAAWNLAGSLAGAAFAAVQKNMTLPPGGKSPGAKDSRNINTVILLGPCYQPNEEGIFLSESDFFETPLGKLQVDLNVNRRITSCSTLFRINDIPHLSEHSLEVLLPFVKYCFPDVKIVPILMNGTRPALVSGLAKALRVVFESFMENSLIVISSNAAGNLDPALALSMAEEFRSCLEGMDSNRLLSGLAEGRISACGGALAGALLESGLLCGKRFSSLSPLARGKSEDGETVYYGAFASL